MKSSPWAAVLAFGGTCQIGQIVFLREFLMVFHGNELAIGLILAAWLFWAGVGSRFGYRWAETKTVPLRGLFWNSIAVAALIPATLVLIRVVRHAHGTLPGVHLAVPDMFWTCLLLTAPTGTLLGLHFVLLARVWRQSSSILDTRAVGSVYIGEAAGAIAGGVLFTFFLVHWVNSFQAAFLAGGLMVVTAWTLIGQTSGRAKDRSFMEPLAKVFLLLAGLAILLPLLAFVDRRTDQIYWRAMAPEHRLVASYHSKYGKIHVAQRENQFSFYQSGHLLFSAAGREVEDVVLEEVEAASFVHLAMTQHPEPRHVLLLGGGLRGTLREILRHPVERVDYVELDPVLLHAARPLLGPESLRALADSRVYLHHGDGRFFVKAAQHKFDLILIDAPDPATAVMNRFYTHEFFSELSERLRPGGVVMLSALSTADLRGRAVANRNATLWHTLNSVFPSVLAVGDRTLYLLASHDPKVLSTDPEILQKRFRIRNIDSRIFSPRRFEILLEDAPLRRTNWILRHHGRHPRAHLEAPAAAPLFPPAVATVKDEAGLSPVHTPTFLNSDFRPIAYYHTLVFWNVLARAEHAFFFERVSMVRPAWVLPPVGLAILAALVLKLVPWRPLRAMSTTFALRAVVFTTGLSTMALQVAVLFAFQATHGFIYEQVGLIVAVFMAGLVTGTYLTHSKVQKKTNLQNLAAVQATIALFAVWMAWSIPSAGGLASPTAVLVIFYFVTYMAGFFNGLDFPLATACCAAVNRRAEKAAGMVYGLELFGACAGAILASAVVVPVLGLAAACYLAAIANGTAALIVVLQWRKEL